jgi:hypothetical protein
VTQRAVASGDSNYLTVHVCHQNNSLDNSITTEARFCAPLRGANIVRAVVKACELPTIGHSRFRVVCIRVGDTLRAGTQSACLLVWGTGQVTHGFEDVGCVTILVGGCLVGVVRGAADEVG